jgi:hypothetical protein
MAFIIDLHSDSKRFKAELEDETPPLPGPLAKPGMPPCNSPSSCVMYY